MRAFIIAAAIIGGLMGFIALASAQNTAQPVLAGFLSVATTGPTACPPGPTPCWLPWTTTNPLPVTTTGN